MSLTPLDDSINLPFLPQLGIKDPINLTDEDVQKIAVDFVRQLSDAIATSNVDSIASLFITESLWRDFLALTWEFNTIFKIENIRKMLEARLAKSQISNVRLAEHRDLTPTKFNPAPPLLLINVPFDFDTAAGSCTGIAKLVPVPSPNGVQWKIFTIFTNLDQLKGFPDKIGPNRRRELPNYIQQRQKEVSFEDVEPRVLVIGAGHIGLDVAARLKVKDVPCLVLDKNVRLGDNWRNRYGSLTLHDPSWMATSPYLSFPANWPGLPPATKYADWLEMYAKLMDINVWTSTTVTHIERDDVRNEWVVHVIKADGTLRVFRPTYVVPCVGFGDPYTPDIPGMDKFRGKLTHAYSEYKGPEEHVGKKVAVIGSATAAHDVCQDHYEHGVDVTMVQRSSTCVIRNPQGTSIYIGPGMADNDIPIDVKDRLGAAFPILVLKKIHQFAMKSVLQVEKPFYDALENAGFQLNHGPNKAGFLYLGLVRQGGFFIDLGASRLIIDKKVKLKAGSIKEFTSTGMTFEDGTSLDADVVIFATGVKGYQNYLQKLLKPELAEKIQAFHLSNEGEFEGVYRECGLPNFFPVIGNLPMGRFYSSHVSLIIKAKEVGLYTDAYKYTEGL